MARSGSDMGVLSSGVALVWAFSLAAGSALAQPLVPSHANQTASERSMDLKPGDVIAQRRETGWSVIKILEIDVGPGGEATAHCLLYGEAADKPDLASSAALPVRILHAPIRAASFSDGWERLGNSPVVPTEQSGFVEYLKQTDFPRYLAFTDQDAGPIVSEANRRYRRGNELAEAGDHEGAIVEFRAAIETFPLFFEAIDNQAFSYMDLGRFDLALEGFEQSLRVNPDGVSAFFSRGECLMRLGRFEEAQAVFEAGQDRFPEQRALFADFLQKARAARGA